MRQSTTHRGLKILLTVDMWASARTALANTVMFVFSAETILRLYA
jgi:hypothetical protein